MTSDQAGDNKERRFLNRRGYRCRDGAWLDFSTRSL